MGNPGKQLNGASHTVITASNKAVTAFFFASLDATDGALWFRSASALFFSPTKASG